MKKIKKPGENISLKTKKNEDPAVMDWINSQSNLMDSLRYLIEREIQQFGVRNLQTVVPTERNGWREASTPLVQDDRGVGGTLSLGASSLPISSVESEVEIEQEPEIEEEDLADEDIEAWV